MAQFEVRACRRDELPAVVELLLSGGRLARRATAAQVVDYAARIYFDSPWAREETPSLVTVGPDGRLEGFVGVMARRMRFGEETLEVAVPGNFVVRAGPDGKVNSFAALAMLKRLFAGPQALTLTDTANEASRRLWEAAGAVAPSAYSLDWFRPIKPATAVLQMMETARGAPLPMAKAGRIGAGAADMVGAPLLARMARNKAAPFQAAPLEPDGVLALLNGRDRATDMRGDYTAEEVGFLLGELQDKAEGRTLRSAMVADGEGVAGGAYVYVLDPSGQAEVMLLAAKEGRFDLVMQAMVVDAAGHGASVVTGAVQPRQMAGYKGQRCFMMCNRWTLVYSKRSDLLDVFHRGRTRLSPLDGERWTRFGDLFAI